jgi:hypothetical protein
LWDTNERGCIIMTTNGSYYHAYLTPEQAIALSVDLGRLAGVVACGRCSGTSLIFKGKGRPNARIASQRERVNGNRA